MKRIIKECGFSKATLTGQALGGFTGKRSFKDAARLQSCQKEKSGAAERIFMKWLKGFGIALLSLPIILIVIFMLYEIFGMCVNHIATGEQTSTLQMHLESGIPDIEIINVYSETGNTSGTGNHVDCLSSVIFSTEMQESEIEARMSKYYVFDEWSCYVNKSDDGYYTIYINTSAPFADNIVGH